MLAPLWAQEAVLSSVCKKIPVLSLPVPHQLPEMFLSSCTREVEGSQIRASRNPVLRGCHWRKWMDHHGPWHLLGQSCEDVSGECGLTTAAQGTSEPRVARLSRAKAVGPPWGRASSRSELRGCLRRKWPDHLGSGHVGTQSSEDVSGDSDRTTMGQGISEVGVARISQLNVAGQPQLRASRNPELPGCLKRKWPDHLSSQHLGPQSCEDVSWESGRTTVGHGISSVRLARMAHAKVA